MPKRVSPPPQVAESLKDQFELGVQNFSRLFTKWMDTNAWSHPIMVSLAASCLQPQGGAARLP